MVPVAALRHAFDDELPKEGYIHLDPAGHAKAPRPLVGVVNLRQGVLQQRVVDADDASPDREALNEHGHRTIPQRAGLCHTKGPLQGRAFDAGSCMRQGTDETRVPSASPVRPRVPAFDARHACKTSTSVVPSPLQSQKAERRAGARQQRRAP